jgi:hypothetical protein
VDLLARTLADELGAIDSNGHEVTTPAPDAGEAPHQGSKEER